MTSNNKVSDVPKCLLRQKQAFKGFEFFFEKNGPDFKIGHTDLDDLKNMGVHYHPRLTTNRELSPQLGR